MARCLCVSSRHLRLATTMPFEDLPLNDGRKIPGIAFGTGSIYKRTDVTRYVQQSLNTGVSFFMLILFADGKCQGVDTAQAYETEGYVGTAIHESGLARSEFYVTTKYSRGAITVDESIRSSLSELGLKFVDLYLIHQAWVTPDIVATWRELEAVQKAGLANRLQLPSPGSTKALLRPYGDGSPGGQPNRAASVQLCCAARGRRVGPRTRRRDRGLWWIELPDEVSWGPADVPVAAAAHRLRISPTQVLLGWLAWWLLRRPRTKSGWRSISLRVTCDPPCLRRRCHRRRRCSGPADHYPTPPRVNAAGNSHWYER
ncbi:NADP-dependent oxidoreductase domain-containing protein [Mycena amicta]|nr:NADP-dependent oxidoreductase domain-containing protein [Mycena amicta]